MKNTLQALLSTGNSKVPYYIFNMGTATDCPSAKLGLCQAGKHCYALKAEKLYPPCKPYRDRQAKYWDSVSAAEFASDLIAIQKGARKMPKILRVSEAGDFRSQADVDKLTEICIYLTQNGWQVYLYTARTDLDIGDLLVFAQVNVSNDHGDWQSLGANRFRMVNKASGDYFVCKGSCRDCNVCLAVKGKTIEVVKH